MEGVIIVPGFNFPYNEIEAALDWAKEYEGSLKVIFITTEEMPSDEYPFPNDMESTETFPMEEKQINGKEQLIRDELKFLQRRATASHVKLSGRFLVNPSLRKVMEECQDADKIFFDRKPDATELMLEGFRFDKDELVNELEKVSQNY